MTFLILKIKISQAHAIIVIPYCNYNQEAEAGGFQDSGQSGQFSNMLYVNKKFEELACTSVPHRGPLGFNSQYHKK